MKTAIVLSFRALGAFQPELLLEPENVRLVLIVSDLEWATVPGDRQAWFHRVYVVPCGAPDGGSLLSSAVEPEAARAALRDAVREAAPGEVTLHCFDELSMMFAAELRAESGLAGPRPDDILPFRDKCVMKDRLVAAGVRVPRFGHYRPTGDPAGDFRRIDEHVGVPFILKPVDSAGSHGVHLISDLAGLTTADVPPGTAYEYEELITGTMYSVNLLSQDRRVVFGGVTEYLVNTLDVRRGRVNADINLADGDPRVARMVAFAGTSMAALGWPDGAAHLELFHTPADELVFLEVGARFKGLAGLAAMQRNYGIAFVNRALEIEAGVPSGPYREEQVPCFDAVIPLRAGVIEQCHEPQLASEVVTTWKVRPGDTVGDTDSLFTSGGTFLVSNKDYAVLYDDFYRLAGYRPITYRTEDDR